MAGGFPRIIGHVLLVAITLPCMWAILQLAPKTTPTGRPLPSRHTTLPKVVYAATDNYAPDAYPRLPHNRSRDVSPIMDSPSLTTDVSIHDPTGARPRKVVLVMHRYAHFIMAANWDLRGLGHRYGFEVTYRNMLFETPKVHDQQPHVLYVRLDLEEPNFLISRYAAHASPEEGEQQVRRHEAAYNHTLSLCPFTSAWVNSILNRQQRTAVYYPFAPQLIPAYVSPFERVHDMTLVAWHKLGRPIQSVLEKVFPNYQSVWITRNPLNSYGQLYHKVKPVFGQTLKDKLSILSRSKVCLVYNAYMDKGENIKAMKRRLKERPVLWSHKAFGRFIPHSTQAQSTTMGRNVPLLLPQLKARTIEAAACGCLMLIYNDGFNIVEKYFTPNEDFLYWDNSSGLNQLKAYVHACAHMHTHACMVVCTWRGHDG